MKQCKAPNCNRKVFSHLYCKYHQYMRKDDKWRKQTRKDFEEGTYLLKKYASFKGSCVELSKKMKEDYDEEILSDTAKVVRDNLKPRSDGWSKIIERMSKEDIEAAVELGHKLDAKVLGDKDNLKTGNISTKKVLTTKDLSEGIKFAKAYTDTKKERSSSRGLTPQPKSDYKKVYKDFFELREDDYPICENNLCNKPMVDVHHIDNKGMGGSGNKDYIENLIGLCRSCHDEAHNYKSFNKKLRVIHLSKVLVKLKENIHERKH